MTDAILPKTDRLAALVGAEQTGRTDPLGLAFDMKPDIAKVRYLVHAIDLMAAGIDRDEDANAFKTVVDKINAALDDIRHKREQLCRQLHHLKAVDVDTAA